MTDNSHLNPPTFIDINAEVQPGVFLRTPYNYDMNEASLASSLVCKDPSLAQQSAFEETEINNIVRRFGITGQLPQGVRIPSYGDFEGVTDFRSALEALDQAEASFMAMSAETRAQFHNDPGLFVDFCSDPANLPAMRKMGLATPDAPPSPAMAPSVASPTPPATPPAVPNNQAPTGPQVV